MRIIFELVYVESQSASLKSSSQSLIFRGFVISCHLNCICYFCVKFANLKCVDLHSCFAISCHVNCNTSFFYIPIARSCHVSCNTSYFYVHIAITCVESGPNWPKLHILLLCSDCPLIVWSVDLYGGSIDGLCIDTSNFSPPLMRMMAKKKYG